MLRHSAVIAALTTAIVSAGIADAVAGPRHGSQAVGLQLSELLDGHHSAGRFTPEFETVVLNGADRFEKQTPPGFVLLEDSGMTLADAIRDIEWRRRTARNLDRLFDAQ